MDKFHNVRAISRRPSEFTGILRREVGLSHPIGFARRFAASESIVQNLMLNGKLYGHEGSVTALEFNSTGDLVISGSDHRQVIFWDWQSTTKLFAYPSDHNGCRYRIKIMPFSNDSRIVTSATDGQVRLGLLWDDGRVDTTLLGKHHGPIYQLAVEPGSPRILYSCGEDGYLKHVEMNMHGFMT